jgi:hypothetical protein
MDHDHFIGQVQARAQLASRGEAEGLTRATLETLGERIPEQVATHLADQLPTEIGENLRRTITMGGAGSGERFGLDEFVRRVSERGHLPEPNAVYGSPSGSGGDGRGDQWCVAEGPGLVAGGAAPARGLREQGRDALTLLGIVRVRRGGSHERRRAVPFVGSAVSGSAGHGCFG